MGDVDTIRLREGEAPPNAGDLLAEIRQERSGGYTSEIISGLLFKEKVPGQHRSVEAALQATVAFLGNGPDRKLYYRGSRAGRKFIKKTRYVRSF